MHKQILSGANTRTGCFEFEKARSVKALRINIDRKPQVSFKSELTHPLGKGFLQMH